MKLQSFTEVETNSRQKLKFNGPCTKCGKNTDQRLSVLGSTHNLYICIKCKTRNKEEK